MVSFEDWFGLLGRILVFFRFSFIVLVLHILLMLTGSYHSIEWIDMPVHFLGGVSLGIGFSFLLLWFQEKQWLGPVPTWLFLGFVLGFAALAVIAWEFIEFLGNPVLYLAWKGALLDTLQDLALGLAGTIVGFGLWKVWGKNS